MLQLFEETLVQAVERHRRLLLHAYSVADHQLSEPLAVHELGALVHPLEFVTGTAAEGARCQEDATLALSDGERTDELAHGRCLDGLVRGYCFALCHCNPGSGVPAGLASMTPQLGHVSLAKITPTMVRNWHAGSVRAAKPTPTRQAYSLLRAMLNTAVADELPQRNPCTVRGAGVSNAAERSVATIVQVNALAEAVPPRYRMLILLAAWSGARGGELVALTRDSLDLELCVMTIDRQYVELRDGSLVLDTPKTAAGVRTVHIPPHLIPALQDHLDTWTTPSSPVIFPNSKDEPIPRASWRSVWLLARDKAGLPHFRFHDLRQTGNTLAAATGASTKELMARMGHASMRAAPIYQHATADRDAAIAVALSGIAAAGVEDVVLTSHDSPPLQARGRARRASETLSLRAAPRSDGRTPHRPPPPGAVPAG